MNEPRRCACGNVIEADECICKSCAEEAWDLPIEGDED